MRDLVLETQVQDDLTGEVTTRGGGKVVFTPPIDQGYWKYRVRLTNGQAILGFPKFGTIGVGFAQEEDWNTNLPYTQDAEKIFNHISHNKGDDDITDDAVRAAIQLVIDAATNDRDKGDSL